MTEIDAKAKMKARMEKMRAAKGKKAEKPKKPVKQKAAVADNLPPEGKEFKTSSTAEPGPVHIKEWTITDFADLCKVPEEHLDFFLGAMRIEIRRAIRSKSKINNFVYNEQHKIQTFLKSEDVFE